MAHYGVGPSGFILTTTSVGWLWASGASGGGAGTVPDPLTLNTLTVNYLTVNSGAALPLFDSLVVADSGTSTLSTVVSGVWNATTIGQAYGGTGQTAYNNYDLLVANGAGTLTTLASGGEGQALRIAGGQVTWDNLDNAPFNLPVISGAGGNAMVAPIPGAATNLTASGWIQIQINGATAYIPIWV